MTPSAKAAPSGFGSVIGLTFKFAVTVVCFWYALRNVSIVDVAELARTLDFRWVGLAILVLVIQIPLVGLRWCRIVDLLGCNKRRAERGPMIAVMAISTFFGQVLPNIASEAIRVWMFSQLGRDWRQGLTSVLIDRGVGVAALMALGMVILLQRSAMTALGGYREVTLEVFGAALLAAALGLVSAPHIAPVLNRWRYTSWIGEFVATAHHIFLGSAAGVSIFGIAIVVHSLTILCVWLLSQALGLELPAADVAVLFVVMTGISILPISISGWGVRELAVTSLLSTYGTSTERALLFSFCFGLVLIVASLPGAIVWAIYSPRCNQDGTQD